MNENYLNVNNDNLSSGESQLICQIANLYQSTQITEHIVDLLIFKFPRFFKDDSM